MAQLKVHPTKHQSLDVSIEMLIMSTFGTIISFINKGDHKCRRRSAEPPPRRVLLLAQVSRWAVQLCDQGTGSCLVWQNPIFVIYSIGSATCQCGFSLNSRAKRLISNFFFFKSSTFTALHKDLLSKPTVFLFVFTYRSFSLAHLSWFHLFGTGLEYNGRHP